MNDEKIIRLKAEMFDLQIELGLLRAKMDEKMRELNALQREKPGEDPRIG